MPSDLTINVSAAVSAVINPQQSHNVSPDVKAPPTPAQAAQASRVAAQESAVKGRLVDEKPPIQRAPARVEPKGGPYKKKGKKLPTASEEERESAPDFNRPAINRKV